MEHSRGDSKETWKILNSALGRRSKTTNINSLLSDKGEEVTCLNEVSNILNNHFATIADKVLIGSEKDYHKLHNGNFQLGSLLSPLDYLSKIRYHGARFQFSRITADDILRNAAKIKNSKSGILPGKFLKDTIYVVVPHLLSFSIGPLKKESFLTILRLLVSVQSIRARALNLILIIIDQSQYYRWWLDYLRNLCMTKY